MSRCWPERQMTGRNAPLAASAVTTGAILIASGRVPNTTRTFIYSLRTIVGSTLAVAPYDRLDGPP